MGGEFHPPIKPESRTFWEKSGEAVNHANQSFVEDPRIDTLMLPLFDGVTEVKWKASHLEGKAIGG